MAAFQETTFREYRLSIAHDASRISEPERQALLTAFDRLTDEIWDKHPELFRSLEDELFTEDVRLVLFHAAHELVGFSIYQALWVDDRPVLYRAATNILPPHQGRGLFSASNRQIVPDELARVSPRPLYLSWRTRNPITWFGNAKWCRSVAPDLVSGNVDASLVQLGQRTAEVLFPELRLDVPSMVMRDAYHMSYKDPQHHDDPSKDALFFRNADLTRQTDVIFSVGEVRVPPRKQTEEGEDNRRARGPAQSVGERRRGDVRLDLTS